MSQKMNWLRKHSTGTIKIQEVDIGIHVDPEMSQRVFGIVETHDAVSIVVPKTRDLVPYDTPFPDGYYVVYKSDITGELVWTHGRWTGSPYITTTPEFLDDNLIALDKPAKELVVGEKIPVGAFFAQVLGHDRGPAGDLVYLVRAEKPTDFLYFMNGIICNTVQTIWDAIWTKRKK